MKQKPILLILSVFLLVACQSSEQAIQTAMAQTQAAIPTLTFTPEPTSTPKPTNTAKPTAAPSYGQLMDLFPDLVADITTSQLGKKIEVTDMELSGNPSPITLTIRLSGAEAGYTASEAMGTLLAILSQTTTSAPEWFPKSLETVVLREYSGLTERGNFTAKWKDLLDYASGKINVDQLLMRGTLVFP